MGQSLFNDPDVELVPDAGALPFNRKRSGGAAAIGPAKAGTTSRVSSRRKSK
jgi:hypothetical protein